MSVQLIRHIQRPRLQVCLVVLGFNYIHAIAGLLGIYLRPSHMVWLLQSLIFV